MNKKPSKKPSIKNPSDWPKLGFGFGGGWHTKRPKKPAAKTKPHTAWLGKKPKI
jgi:hypothetical protein